MRAIRIDRTDDGTRAALQDVRVDELTEGNVIIRSHYSSINYKDALAVTGKGKILHRYPLNGGIDVAGVVEQSEDDRFQPGDEVVVTGYFLSEKRDGGFAEQVRVPADCVVSRPEGLTLFETMALGTAGFTAGYAVRRLVENHQTPDMGPIAVTGATGGVGSFAISLLAARGFEVKAVTRKTDSAGDYLRGLGAAEVISPDDIPDDGKPMSRTTWGGGVDSVGGELLARLIKQIVPYGNVAAIGLAGGVKLETTVLPFILRGVTLAGVDSVMCPRPRRLEAWQRLARDLDPALLARMTQQIGLAEALAVAPTMLAGQVRGRVVVDVNA